MLLRSLQLLAHSPSRPLHSLPPSKFNLPRYLAMTPSALSFSASLPLLASRLNPRRRSHSAGSVVARRRRLPYPISATAGVPSDKDSELRRWGSTTAKFAAASNLPFLLIQLPQILLNSNNLVAGNKAALLAVPWLGMLTGLLGNLTLLSYFVKKNEKEAVVVQTLGVLSIYVVISQLAMAEAMHLWYFVGISAVVACGLAFNFMKYFGWILDGLWGLWEDFVTVAGLSVLPQVMWSTFVPFLPNSILPGTISCFMALGAVTLARAGKLPEKWLKFLRNISGWIATLLFMWMPIAQMWTTYLNPDNIKGLSALTILLGMIGNGLMIPRALFIRDLMWFTGASWASFLHGWGNLACMWYFKSISKEFFLAATLSLFIWTGVGLWRDAKVFGYDSPMKSLRELVAGT